ncbi:hypothetical protein SUGI_0624170 [Cryptomeria japonica]|nr:hypothetical protein SUGI_0624170 [Cryptomeria japonica]
MLSAIAVLSGNDQAENSVRLTVERHEDEEIQDSWSSFAESESQARGEERPDKKITLFALRLALLEKAASVLGTLGFIWATVVLLGGFAITLERADFWFITTILVIESTRIFSRSHELEWQHETTLSVADLKKDAKLASCRFYRASCSFLEPILRPFSAFKISKGEDNNNNNRAPQSANSSDQGVLRRWSSSNVQLLPYARWFSVSKEVSKLLFWSQLLSAMTCVVLSVYRLAEQDFGVVSGSDKKNRRSALNIFYGLSLAEALLFLLEKAYWQWKIIAGKLLVEVNQEYGFDPPEVPAVRRFFYDAYFRCVNGSVFDGLKMDLVSFSVELLKSGSAHGQVTGARLLSSFLKDRRFEQETLRTIGAMPDLVGRLVEMLNWRNPREQEIRRAAAEIISCLVKEKRNSLRVARIPGALHSITSLLREPQGEIQPYDYLGFSLLGLQILNNLAKHPGNCGKIGSNEKLLLRINEFTDIKVNFESEARIQNVKLSLILLKMLASTKGAAGEVLRKRFLEIVFTISNLRDVLLYRGINHVQLQTLAAETLSNLAMEDEGRVSIGSTGGVMDVLFSLFFTHSDEETKKLVSKAGEALTLLSLENKQNCRSMIKLKSSQCGDCDNVITVLIAALSDSFQGVHAARILRNICEYAETDHEQLREVSAAAAKVVKLVLEEQGTFQEASMGLAAQIFKFLSKTDMDSVFEEAATTKDALLMHLVEILRSHSRPSTSFPNIRRFCIELAISVLQKDKECFGMEKLVLKAAVENVMETTSEIERYSILSGSIGLARHRITIHSLLQTALRLLSA